MPQPLLEDVRVRLFDFVEKGHSRRGAGALRFKTAASSVVNFAKLWKDTGNLEPRVRVGFRHGKLKPYKAFILGCEIDIGCRRIPPNYHCHLVVNSPKKRLGSKRRKK